MTIFTIQTIAFAILTVEKTILETCDIWDTNYNSDNWEPEFMTIFVTWQLIVTLDSIRNSCDVFVPKHGYFWQKMGTKKWHFGCPNENSKTTFISPTSPKNNGIAFGFKRLPLLGLPLLIMHFKFSWLLWVGLLLWSLFACVKCGNGSGSRWWKLATKSGGRGAPPGGFY